MIRPCRPDDWPAYRELRLQALRDHPTAFGASYEDNLLHPQEHWEKRMETDDEREALFFAEFRGATDRDDRHLSRPSARSPAIKAMSGVCT